nr:reverse transcriptase domain-containing protein [Tanacetum cinerariifolium]
MLLQVAICWKDVQDVLTIIENKSKVRNSRNKSVVSQVKSCDANSNSSSEKSKLTHAVNQQTSDVTTAKTAILKQFQATPPPASIKAVKETCVTCGGAHPYYQCLAAGGNTFPELRDNIQGYVLAVVVNYNQGNFVYRPPCMVNQIRPPGFAQPNVQNNQNRFGQPQGFNRGNNFNPEQSYQAPTQQNQIVPLNELEKAKRMNEANMKAMQTQINMVENELRNEIKNSIQASLSNQTNEIKNMMASLFQMNFASTSGSGSLPSNTVANPNGELKAITTRSGHVIDGPIVPTPHPFINPEEDERVEETLTDPDLAEYTIKKMLKALLSNKEKLQELANTHLNENCSAVILKKLPKKLGDPGKFLISCGFSELKCKALADLSVSINLMPLSVWKKLGLPELISTRMTLELANRAICTPARIARDVFVPVGKFTLPADFVIVDYESDPRVPLILGRPFLRTARALIDVHGEEMILRDGDEILTLNMRHDTSSYSNQPRKESINLINVFNDSKGGNVLPKNLLDLNFTKDLHPPLHVNPLSGSTTYSSSTNPLPEELTDELALITFPLKYDDDLQFDVESDLKEIGFLLHQDIDSSLKDLIDQSNLANPGDNFVDSMPEMFTDELVLDYLSPSIFDKYDDDFLEVEPDTENDFSRVDALPSTNNEDKIFNPGILIQKKPFEIITHVIRDKKLAISNASLILEDFDPPLYEPLFFKEVPSILENVKTHTEGFCPPVFISSASFGNHDIDSSLKDLIDQSNLANPADNFVDYMPEMFTDELVLDYLSPPIFDKYDDDFLEVEPDTENDFSRVDALPSINNEDKIFNPGILIQEKPFEIITHVIRDKKLAISNASLILEDFDPPLYEPLFFKEDPSILENVKTYAEGFCPPVFISSTSFGNH